MNWEGDLNWGAIKKFGLYLAQLYDFIMVRDLARHVIGKVLLP